MFNSLPWQVTWTRLIMALIMLPPLLSVPDVIAAPSELVPTPQASAGVDRHAALAPSQPGLEDASAAGFVEGDLQEKIAAAKTILEELRDFAEIAQNALRLGDRLKTTRLANLRLKRDLEKDQATREDLLRHVDPVDTEIAALTRTIVANWLASNRLDRRKAIQNKRLARAENAWLETERRLVMMKRKAAQLRANFQKLRTEGTALAVELGHTRRQIITLTAETRLAERHRLVIETETNALRKGVSAGLRAILSRELNH